ncbi:MAG: hypothetical protein V1648_00650 [Candidatus Aenigmatarchaeota archaeon]
MRTLKGRKLLDYWRDMNLLIPAGEYEKLEGRYHSNPQMTRHEDYLKEAVLEVMNNGFMMKEIGINLYTEENEFDLVGITNSGYVICVEVKCSPRRIGEARRRLIRFKRVMPNKKTHLYRYIGEIGLMEEVFLH